MRRLAPVLALLVVSLAVAPARAGTVEISVLNGVEGHTIVPSYRTVTYAAAPARSTP